MYPLPPAAPYYLVSNNNAYYYKIPLLSQNVKMATNYKQTNKSCS